MGTPLTGLTPAATRVGLIKTTDNAALTSTLKLIGDGTGNDSTLYLAIGKVGFNEAVAMTKTSTEINTTVAKVAYISVTQNVNLDTMESDISSAKTKTDFLTVTGNTNLDTIRDNYLSTSTAASTYLTQANAASSYQPLDADLTTLAGLTATTDNFIVSVSSAWASRTPAQVKTTLSLNNVENTALSTWAGSSNITTLGTISTGTWSGTPIAPAKGGTGLTALGSGLQVLRTNAGATAMEWATISAGGGDLLASNNLSDLTNFATARTNLGLAIGTNVQAYSANLTTYAGIAPSANVQTLLGAANYSAFRTSLGVAIGSDVQAYNSNLATIAGLTATTDNFIVSVSSAWASRTPAQVKTTLSLNLVENTALSTWAGSSTVTTLGTVTTGTWNASPIDYSKGGSGLTSFTALSIAVTNTANTRTQITPSAGQAVRMNSAGSAWEAYQTQFTKNFDISNWAMAVDSSGNCIMEDSFVKQSNDRYYGKRIIMKDSGTKTGLGVSFTVPSDYVGSAYLCIIWMSTATSGNNVVFDVDYTCNAKTGVTGDPSSDEENATATTADSTTSMQRVVTEIALTSANLSANQQFAGNISRDGASASDTLAADIVIENIFLKYNNY